MTKSIPQLAEVVAALWVLGADNARLHDEHGFFDRALLDIKDDLPTPFSSTLIFSATGVGLRCLQWPEMVSYMEEAHMAERDGTTFTTLRVTVSRDLAQVIMAEQAFPKAMYTALATKLHERYQHYFSAVSHVQKNHR